MPLKPKVTLGKHISELLTSYKQGGSFAKGKSATKARQMAIAAAFNIRNKLKGG